VLLHAPEAPAMPASSSDEKITTRKRFDCIGKLLFGSPRGATTMEQLDRSRSRCPSGSLAAGGTECASRRPLAPSLAGHEIALLGEPRREAIPGKSKPSHRTRGASAIAENVSSS
jgi:hypothetical protein